MLNEKILHIENFGKMRKADIDLQDFILFVGDNNSGKTTVMQLIYGFYDYVIHFHCDYRSEKKDLKTALDYFNQCLESDKNKIVEKTFHHKINIDKLWLEIDLEVIDCNYHSLKEMLLSIFHLSKESLYIPSSGVGLLYKENTKPIDDYLRYLQKWSLNLQICDKNKELLDFFEKRLIEGRYVKENQLTYVPNGTESHIPMQLTSSMICKLIPYYYYITSHKYTSANCLMIEEAESCLHPSKQMELVQFFIKLNNDGKRIIMSTHSDSMASKINNMVILANKVYSRKKEYLEKLGLTYSDLFDNFYIKVYSFSNKGTYSVVNKVEYDNRLGFSFEQFEDSFSKLYKEASIIINSK